MTRLHLRGAAVMTVAALSLGGAVAVAPTANADTPAITPAAAPAGTSLAIRAGKQAVKPGGAVTVAGNLRFTTGEPAPGKTLTLEAKPESGSEFLPIGIDVAGDRGGVVLKVNPAEVTRYRWVFGGDETAAAAVSGVVRVGISTSTNTPNRLPTSLSIRLKQTEETQVVAGALLSRGYALRYKRVILLAKPEGATSWEFRRGKRTNDNGRVAFHVRPAKPTHFRLIFLGTENFRGARSGVVTASPVNPAPSSLSIRARVTDKGFVIAGSLLGGGQALADRPVTLEVLAPGETTWVADGRKRTNEKGFVRFVRQPATGTQFRLVFVGGYRYAPAISGVVTS